MPFQAVLVYLVAPEKYHITVDIGAKMFSSPGKQGSNGFSIDAPVDPFPVNGRGRSILLTCGVRAAVTGRPGEGFRNPCDFAAEAVLFGKLFPRDPLFLTVLFPISELVVVTDPLPVADDISKDAESLAMALATIPNPFYTALITSERSKSATRSDPTKSGCLTDPSWRLRRCWSRSFSDALEIYRNQNRSIYLNRCIWPMSAIFLEPRYLRYHKRTQDAAL